MAPEGSDVGLARVLDDPSTNITFLFASDMANFSGTHATTGRLFCLKRVLPCREGCDRNGNKQDPKGGSVHVILGAAKEGCTLVLLFLHGSTPLAVCPGGGTRLPSTVSVRRVCLTRNVSNSHHIH